MGAGQESRTARAVVFAAVCVLLAALGHATMSGVGVPWWALAAGFAVIGVIGWCCTGRERGQVFVTTVTVVTQVLLHSLFTLSQQLSGSPPGMDSMGSLRGSVDSMPGMGSMAHMPSTGMSPMACHSGSYGMLAAHLLAALLCGLWLAHGERAAFRIGRALAARLFAPLLLLIRIAEPPYRPRVRADRPRSSHRLRSLLLVHAITTRGPPRGIAVA